MNNDLLELLACPECGSGALVLGEGVLTCPDCRARYPIKNGIPYMLPAHLSANREQKDPSAGSPESVAPDGEAGVERDLDMLRWERELYGQGKEVIYSNARAAELFSSYSEKGARTIRRFLEKKAGGVWGRRILYVGSGNDRPLSLPLEGDGAFLVNLDIVGECLDDLREAGARNCVCGDSRRLPFRVEAFDVVFSKGSVHHSHPISEPIHQMTRVLRGGGHILLAEPRSIFDRRDSSGLGCPTPYEHALSVREVVSALEAEGISGLGTGILTNAPPGTPTPVAILWEGLGNALPWLFGRFAFEFMVYGRKI